MKTTALILTLALFSQFVTAQWVSTYAGTGVAGYNNGPKDNASFSGPEQMAYDSEGNLYIADSKNNVIRKVDQLGVVSTYAGTGVAGFQNGPRTTAMFNSPLGITIDKNNSIYVTEDFGSSIRKISAAGIVSTYAGNDSFWGYVDGPDSIAEFGRFVYLCLDDTGNLYVADAGNKAIRKVGINGMVTTLAGGDSGFVDGTGIAAKFSFPSGITYNAKQRVFYVSDRVNSAIRKITPEGVVTTYAGGTAIGHKDGPRAQALFNGPKDVITDSMGNLFVAGRLDYTIRKIDTNGIVSTVAGTPLISGFSDGPALSAFFVRPISLVWTPEHKMLISDWDGERIRLFDPASSTGLSGIDQREQFMEVIPNPTNQFLFVTTNTKIQKVVLVSMLGQVIDYTHLLNPSENKLDISELKDGAYWLMVTTETGTQQKVIIKR
jgi:hypothetical protein